MPLAGVVVAVLLLLVLAPPAGAAGAWYELGSAAGPVNHDPDADAYEPRLGIVDERPWVAYTQATDLARAIRAARFTGRPLDARPWRDVTGGQINHDGARDAYDVDVAVVEGVPHIAWVEHDGTNQEARVARWDGTAWVGLGNAASPINVSPVGEAAQVRIAAIDSMPYVTWSEGTQLHVKRWNEGAWEHVGAGPLNMNPSYSASTPDIVGSGNTPWVVWTEHDDTAGKVVVRVKYWTGAVWAEIVTGSNPLGVGATPFDPAIAAAADGDLYVAWGATSGGLELRRLPFEGNAWQPVAGGAIPGRGTPSMTVIDDRPYIAALEVQPANAGLFKPRVWRVNDAGTAMETVGDVLTSGFDHALPPDLVEMDGTPLVAWTESDEGPSSPTATRQVHVAAYGEPPQNVAAPALTGVPQTGQTLTCGQGTWTNATTFTTLWQRGTRSAGPDDASWHAIDGAEGTTYTVQQADEGSRVRCLVVAGNPVVSAERASASKRTDAGVPVATTAPRVGGRPVSGETLTCEPGQFTGNPDVAYRWMKLGAPIPGATSRTYTTKKRRYPGGTEDPGGDGDRVVWCEVAGTNDIGTGPWRPGGYTHVVDGPPKATRAPVASQSHGDPNPLRPVSCDYGGWLDDYGTSGIEPYKYTHQWLRNDAPIGGATGSTYRPTPDDLGRRIACQVTNTNPAGTTVGPKSNEITITLPTGVEDTAIYREGGDNQADPTNLLAISGDYINAIRGVVIGRLNTGIAAATEGCRRTILRLPEGERRAPNPAQVKDPISTELRCRILTYDKDRVQPYFDGGVRYRTGACTAAPDFATAQSPVCPSLRIEVAAIDPKRPPAQDAELMKALEPVTPKRILWDIDGDGRTDASCPGSAPVLRTIYDPGRWRPRAVILDLDDRPAHFGSTRFTQTGKREDGRNPNTVDGAQRGTQVKVCATSFDPPKEPEHPCVTSGDIGRIHISNANLCPIDAREIANEDFTGLLDGALQKLLVSASEARLPQEGAVTSSAGGDRPARPVYVDWDPPKARAAQAGATLSRTRLVSGTLANTVASVTQHANTTAQTSSARRLSRFYSGLSGVVPSFKPENGEFATSQIYISRGEPLTVNGVLNDPLGTTAALLIPTDVQNALPGVKEMAFVGRDIATQLGPEGVANAVPLASGGKLASHLRDQATGEAQTLLRKANLEKAVDIPPFSFMGESKLRLNKDGTATLEAHAAPPGLTGLGGSPLTARVVVHADLEGRVRLETIHLHADHAFLAGMELENLDLVYSPDTGLKITGALRFPAPISQGINVKRFEMGPAGQFRAFDIDWFATPGNPGIPVGPGLNMTLLGAHLDLPKSNFGAHTILSIGSSTGKGCPTLGLDATLDVNMAAPFSVDGNAGILVTCLNLGNLHFHADGGGLVSLVGTWKLDAGPLYANIELGAAFRSPQYQVWGGGAGGVRGVLDARIEAVLSNRGLAGCGAMQTRVPVVSEIVDFLGGPKHTTVTVKGGASVDFDEGRPPFTALEILNNLSLFVGCDIGAYYPLGKLATARAAQAGSTSFAIPAGAGPSLLSLEGAGDAPLVRLRSPSGKVYDLTDARRPTGKSLASDVWGTVLDSEDRTVAIIGRPERGTWTAEVAPGSPAVARVRRAAILPPVAVKARVGGRGVRRTLRYAVYPQKGQVVRFVELAKGGRQVLKTVRRGGSGTVRFRVAEARSRTRRIIAEVDQDGRPRAVRTLARFTAANPRVGRAGRLKLRRRGTRAVLTWRPGALAAVQYLDIRTGGGERRLERVGRRARSFTLRGLARTERATVRIQAVSAGGRKGAMATARLAAAQRRGAVKRTRPGRRKR